MEHWWIAFLWITLYILVVSLVMWRLRKQMPTKFKVIVVSAGLLTIAFMIGRTVI